MYSIENFNNIEVLSFLDDTKLIDLSLEDYVFVINISNKMRDFFCSILLKMCFVI